MELTTEEKAHLKHLKREVEIAERRVLATQIRHLSEWFAEEQAVHAHHLACERLRAYRETIND